MIKKDADDDFSGMREGLSYVSLDNLEMQKQTECEDHENSKNERVLTDKTTKNTSKDFYTKWDVIRTNALKNTHNVF
jgi:hypothetical protein